MEIAIQFLKSRIMETYDDTELSPLTKQLMVSEFQKAINVLEYERYNFVPNKDTAEKLNMVEEWKKQWETGKTKFVPELLGFTKAVVLDNGFSAPIEEPEIITTQAVENKEPLLVSDIDIEFVQPQEEHNPLTFASVSEHLRDEITVAQGEVGSEEFVVNIHASHQEEEEKDVVYVEGRTVEEPKVEGRKKGLFSWFK